MKSSKLITMAAAFMLTLSACGGSSGGGPLLPPGTPPPPPPPITTAEAFQFLNQSTFGATSLEAQDVINQRFEAWIDEEMSKSVSLQLPYLRGLPRPQNLAELHADRVDKWFRNVVDGNDQLRQRVAFALSEILVVSQLGALIQAPYSVADFHSTLR